MSTETPVRPTARVHLELMSKQALIQRIRRAESAAAYWRTRFGAITAFDVPEDATPDEVQMIAQRILEALPEDPLAWKHREQLLAALDDKSTASRCHMPGCRRPLDDKGRCTRHDWRVRGAERERVAS